MLKLGATTFWEDFDVRWLKNAAPIDRLPFPGEVDVHATYGSHCYKGFRHSLCHGWASGADQHGWLATCWAWRFLSPAVRKSAFARIWTDWIGAKGSYPTPFGVIKLEHKRLPDGSIRHRRCRLRLRLNLSMKTLEQEFHNPSAAYRGKPFWAWNGKLEEQELLRQIDVLHEMGFGGFFMHSRTGLQTEYLGEDWFRLTDACIKRAQELGMQPMDLRRGSLAQRLRGRSCDKREAAVPTQISDPDAQ